MDIFQTKFYSISIVIDNFTASAHITYYAHITPSPLYHYTVFNQICIDPKVRMTLCFWSK